MAVRMRKVRQIPSIHPFLEENKANFEKHGCQNLDAVATSILRTRHDNCKMFSDNFLKTSLSLVVIA